MSAKSSIKLLVPDGEQGTLYRWVALLTGSKNALKGVGFFLGGALLATLGFGGAVLGMAALLAAIWLFSLWQLRPDLGKAKAKPKFRELLSKSPAINGLSAARLFLFGARDVWFVVALPVYLSTVFGWDFWQVGGFLAAWVYRLRRGANAGASHYRQKAGQGAGWAQRLCVGCHAGRPARCHRARLGRWLARWLGGTGRAGAVWRTVRGELVAA